MKEEKFPHTRKPLHWQRWGSFGATEENAATGVQRAKHSHTLSQVGARS